MKSILIAVVLVFMAAIVAAHPSDYRSIAVVSKIDTRDPLGQYALKYVLSDGTVFKEEAALKRTPDDKDNVLVKKGSYKYKAPEGVEVKVSYTADEYGYRTISDIPKAVASVGQ